MRRHAFVASDGVDDAGRDGREMVDDRNVLQAANYNEWMIVVRYATLAALVLWLGAMTGTRFGDVVRRVDLVAYVCGGAVLVGLLVMKFVGPPPRQFFARAGITALMLALAAGASAVRGDAARLLAMVNIALGFLLLMWYVRE